MRQECAVCALSPPGVEPNACTATYVRGQVCWKPSCSVGVMYLAASCIWLDTGQGSNSGTPAEPGDRYRFKPAAGDRYRCSKTLTSSVTPGRIAVTHGWAAKGEFFHNKPQCADSQ
ncbi:hypothetical protein Bbelb_248820 [Branchiostoma belcheri]|nr:hypothetical protein Bbelb_248820 [Branchiostoma belcheri]